MADKVHNGGAAVEDATDVGSAEQDALSAPDGSAQDGAAVSPGESKDAAVSDAPTGANRFSKIGEEKRRVAAKRRRRKKIIKWTVVLVIVLAVAAAAAFGIWKLFFEPEPPVPDQTAFSYRGPFSNFISGYGQVKANRTEGVTAPARGELLELFVSEGDMVYEGQPLFNMDDSALRQQIADVEKSIEALRDTRQGYVDSRTKAYENRAKIAAGTKDFEDELVDIARKLESRNLTAPFNGKILQLSAQNGQMIEEGTVVGLLARDEEMTIKQYFSYAFEADVYLGQRAEVSIPSSMEVLTGRVTGIDWVRRVSPEGGVTFAVTVTVKNPGALTKGMEAMAVLFNADGGEITPSEAGAFDYSKTETLLAPARGKITYLSAIEFGDCKQGDALYYLSDDGYINQVDELKSRIESVEENLEGFDDQIQGYNRQIEEVDIQIAEKYDEIAELTLKFPEFNAVAPMSGMVTAITAMPGQMLEERASVLAISDTTAMTVDMNLDERDVGKVSIGTMVNLYNETSDGSMFYMGTVVSISLEGNYDWGYAYFPATVRIEGGEGLRSGSSMRYEIMLSSKEDCVLVPIAAVKYTDTGTCVFVKLQEGEVAPDDAAELGEGVVPEGYYAVLVETGLSDTGQIEIVSGITDGVELYLQPGIPGQGGDMYGMVSSVRYG